MDLMKIAIGLELGGFILASISVFLKIGMIRKTADRCKRLIFNLNATLKKLKKNSIETHKTLYPNLTAITNDQDLILFPILEFPRENINHLKILWKLAIIYRSVKKSKKKYQTLDTEKLNALYRIIDKGLESDRFKKLPKRGQQHVRDFFNDAIHGKKSTMLYIDKEVLGVITIGFKLAIGVIFTLWPTIIIVSPSLAMFIFLINKIEIVTNKLTEADIITDIFIFVGTLGLIAGLSIEFIVL